MINQYDAQPFLQRQVVPPPSWVPPQQPPNPDLTALHQAHLRSPRLSIVDLPMPNLPLRYYQAIRNFAIAPVVLSRNTKIFRFAFTVPEDISSKLVSDGPFTSLNGFLATRECRPGLLQYRIRCTAVQDDKPNPYDWVTAETVWPQHIFIELNNVVLGVRRKGHYGKDLPIDVTRYIASMPGIQHHIEIASLPPDDTKHSNYGFALELVEMLEHQQIIDMVTATSPPPPLVPQRIPAAQTIAGIAKTLAGGLNEDDDEIAMIVSDLTIDLADPFMAKIFNIPARGSRCLHRECFDLETFLNTRHGKKARTNYGPETATVSLADVWKCPLCGKDARPYSLRIDEFLVGVRAKLETDGMLDCKAILVSKDGSWKPKLEKEAPNPGVGEPRGGKRNDEDDKTTMNEAWAKPMILSGANGAQPKQKDVIEVIELDDD